MQKIEKPKRPLIFYYFMVMVVMILLNTLLFPRLMRQEVVQVDYGTFLTMLDNKEVAVAQVEQDVIYFTDTSEEPGLYSTITFNDPDLVNRLWASGCQFAEVKPPGDEPHPQLPCDLHPAHRHLHRHRAAHEPGADEENGRRSYGQCHAIRQEQRQGLHCQRDRHQVHRRSR